MSKTFVMSWLADGKVRMSKNAPAILQSLGKSGFLNQGPIACLVRKPRDALARKFKKAPEGLNSNNVHDVAADQIWESLDPRHTSHDGHRRQVRILEVGATHVLVQGMRHNTKSLINLRNFNGKGTRAYRRVLPTLQRVQAEA